MTAPYDPEALFRKVTGCEMRKQDADDFRRLKANMPATLADSPSYTFDLILKFALWQKVRSDITDAFEAAVEHSYREARRIHNSSPSSSAGFLRGVVAACFLVAITSTVSAAAVLGLVSTGTITPRLSQANIGKIAWADAVEARIGRGSVDWTMRDGNPDPSLQNILNSLNARGNVSEPSAKPSQLNDCRTPRAVSGRSSCHHELDSRASRVGQRSVRR